MTSAETAAILLHGALDADAAPELLDAEFAAAVRENLREAGMALRFSCGHWSAVAAAPLDPPQSGFHGSGRLMAGQAMLLVLYAWLADADGRLAVERLEAAGCSLYAERYVRGPLLGFLTGHGFLVQEDGILRPGPEFALIDRWRVQELLVGAVPPRSARDA